MKQPRGIIAICENPQCGAIFEQRGIIGGQGGLMLEFKNTKIGPCPNCGGVVKIPDGLYQYLDYAVSFIEGPPESVEVLNNVKELLQRYQSSPASKEQVIKEVEKIAPSIGILFQKAPESFDYAKWIEILLLSITLALTYYKDYIRAPDRDTIKEKLIENLIEENKQLRKDHPAFRAPMPAPGPQTQVSKHKIGRNDPCYCGSKKKYKKCCLNKK